MGTLHLLRCKTQHYEWGSTEFIPELLGEAPDGAPHAELWMGAHAGAPSWLLVDGALVELGEFIRADPLSTLGAEAVDRFGPTLPFLVKVLAAAHPLSLQAHPSKARASARSADETHAGISVSSPTRLYKDGNHKPELICALTRFEALCGFRPLAEAADLFGSLDDPDAQTISERLRTHDSASALEVVVEDLLRRRIPTSGIVAASRAARLTVSDAMVAHALGWCSRLADLFPDDPGAVISLLMNYVRLEPGEALSLPSGNLHAYLHGAGIELMANSDNVLRGGLTSKHIDVDELLAVVDWNPLVEPVIRASIVGPVSTYPSPSDEFELTEIHLGTAGRIVEFRVTGPEILLCVDGAVTITANDEALGMTRGQVVFVEAAATKLIASGEGARLYRATIGAAR